MNAQKICNDLFNIATDIYNELGGGFNEAVHQNALAIEFRDNGIKYIKEVNIEVFYKGQSVGTDRPDFVLLSSRKKSWNLNEPLVIETKVASNITNDHIQQLKSYLKSFPHNKNTLLHSIKRGVLLKFLKNEDFDDPDKTKMPVEIEFWKFSKTRNKMRLIYRMPVEVN